MKTKFKSEVMCVFLNKIVWISIPNSVSLTSKGEAFLETCFR